MSIHINVPAEVRKYKEKLVAGLTLRQLIAVGVILLVCLPLYIGGMIKGYNEELLSWLVIIIGGTIGSFGFIKYHGMPMEKAAVAFLKYMIYPGKRVVKTQNAYRIEYEKEKKKSAPQNWWQRMMLNRYEKQASLERMVLMQEAEARGDMTHETAVTEKLITAKKPTFGGFNGGGKDPQKKDKKKKEKPAWETEAEAVQAKLDADPFYVPTPAENKLLLRLNQKILSDKKREMEQKKREVAEQNNKLKKRRNVQLRIPTSVADSIPLIAAYDEGMFEVAPNKYSKAYIFSDINYKTAKPNEQEEIFCHLRDFYNYFSEDVHIAVCVDNRVISREQLEREVYYKLTGDKYDKHRIEYNRIMGIQMKAGNNNMRVEKYLIVTIDAAEPMEALLRFHKLDIEVCENFRKMGVAARVVSTTERLAYFHDKFRPGHEGQFRINYDFLKKEGLSEKDYIAPSSFDFSKTDSMQIGNMYYRVMFLTNLARDMSDESMRRIYDVDFPVTVTHNIKPVNQEWAKKMVNRQLTSIKKDKMEAEKRAVAAGYSPENIREELKDSFTTTSSLINDLNNNNQKLFFTSITVMVGGATRQELESNCDILKGKAQSIGGEFLTLNIQQEEAYKTTLPFGYVSKDLCIDRTMTSESTTVFVPFTCTEIYQLGGFYYGLNAISKNFVMLDRNKMKTASGFVVGSTGSGKSFACKREIINILLHDNESSVIIIDPENEYFDFTKAFGGVTVKISPDSNSYIDPMEMPEDYGLDENDTAASVPLPVKKSKALKKKSSFIMSIVERMISVGGNGDESTITPQQKTIVDKCVRAIYKDYLDHDFDKAYLPTLLDFQESLDALKNESEVAREIAEGVEYYTRGSMDVFAHKSNIDLKNRLICFNIRDLGEQLRLIGFVIVFDFINNKIMENKNRSVRTYCYCDEIHLMFKTYYAAEFFKDCFKRGRKLGLVVTGITQNCTELLYTNQARLMIGNSDYVMMLNQKAEDLELLSQLLSISDEQKMYVSGAEPGCGLIYAEKVIVPFVDNFPKDSYLYKLMSTKFGETMTEEEAEKQIMAIVNG